MLALGQGKPDERLAIGKRPAVMLWESMRLCVAHLFEMLPDPRGVERKTAVGTAFFISEPLPDGLGDEVTYVVTARHLLERPIENDGPLILRIDAPGGDGFVDVITDPRRDWTWHPQTDVAIARLDSLQIRGSHGFSRFSTQRFAYQPAPYVIELGERVFLIGLFAQLPGIACNEPVVRFGHVSRALGEQIEIGLTELPTADADAVLPRRNLVFPVDAYLVEATAWGGQSGSPVFVNWPEGSRNAQFFPGQNGPWLLGLVHGYGKQDEPLNDPAHPERGATVPFNAGLTVVIPARSIRETLDLPQLRQERDDLCRR